MSTRRRTLDAPLWTLWAGCAAFVPIAAIATLAVELWPHARGIAFVPQLRFAVITPICLLVAIGGAFVYQTLAIHVARPRRTFAAIVVALVAIVSVLITLLGSRELRLPTSVAAGAVGLGLAMLVPPFVERPPRRLTAAAVVVIGILELSGVAAALASERVPVKGSSLPFDIPRELFDVEHRFVDLPDGARVHYVDVGSGDTLLFLHGNPAWSFQWRDLIAGLRRDFRCIALDYPGFGLSSAPQGFGFTPREQSLVLEAFVDRLRLHDVTLVMQDWGGPIGLGLAGRRPELIRRVVLGNTWAWETQVREPRGLFSKIAGGPVGEFAQMNFNAFAKLALKQGVVRDLPPDVADLYVRPFQPLERRGVAAFYPGQITSASEYMREVEAGLGRLADGQALIFWGLLDPGFPRADLERFQRAFPNHRTIELPHANHFFFEDASERIIEEVQAFAKERRSELGDVFEVKHISVSINRSSSDVYAFISDGANLAHWGSGLGTTFQRDGDEWLVQGPLGTARVRIAKRNDFGVADQTVTLDTGVTVHNPIRVVANGDGCTVTFTLMRLPGVSERKFTDDAAWVQKDLETLKANLEKR